MQNSVDPSLNPSSEVLPRLIVVEAVTAGRYDIGTKPVSWDDRKQGIEKIKTSAGESIAIFSDGGQSTPAPGWQLILTKLITFPDGTSALGWTLYGVQRDSRRAVIGEA